MKVFIDPREAYTPIHCDECQKESRATIILSTHTFLCLECIRKAELMLAAKERRITPPTPYPEDANDED